MEPQVEERQRILIVDDERFNINVLADLLKPNYKVMAAINGAQALKAARSVPGMAATYAELAAKVRAPAPPRGRWEGRGPVACTRRPPAVYPPWPAVASLAQSDPA